MSSSGLISPKTKTPESVYGGLWILGVAIVVFVTIVVAIVGTIVGVMIDANLWFALLISAITGALLGFWSLGVCVPYVTSDVRAYIGRIMVNEWTKTQRVLFQGLNPILPWETPAKDIDLQAEAHDIVGKDGSGNILTWPTANGRITATYAFAISPNLHGKYGMTPEVSVPRWGSSKLDTIQTIGRALFSQTFSDFVKKMTTEQVIEMGKKAINDKVFASDAFKDFEEEYGAVCEVVLEDVDRDPAIEKAREIIAKAESAAQAIAALRKTGMSKARAEEFVEYYSFPDNVQKIKLDVKGLENLEHFSGILPTGSFGGKTGGDEKNKKDKKGGHK